MQEPFLFPRQLEALSSGNDKKVKIAIGSVRSGKSILGAVEAVKMALQAPSGMLVFVARTLANVHSNICQNIREIFGKGYISDASDKATTVRLLGREVRCIGADNIAVAEKIKGLNVAGIICDEISTYPEAVFKMLLTRLDGQGVRLIGTTNPDSTLHWLKKMIDSDFSSFHVHQFRIEDNPLLDEAYKKMLRETLRGAFYKRYYLGEWAAAEGVVYSDFGEHLVGDYYHQAPEELICGIDFGLKHKTEAVMVASSHICNPPIWVPRSICIDQNPSDVHTVSQVAEEIVEWMSPYFPSIVYVDPAALVLKTELRRHLPKSVAIQGANNDVINGINYVSRLFFRREIGIDSGCIQLIKELQSYCWDEVASTRLGKDQVKKENDDGVDALRYAIYSRYGLQKDPLDVVRKEGDKAISTNKKQPNYKQILRGERYGQPRGYLGRTF